MLLTQFGLFVLEFTKISWNLFTFEAHADVEEQYDFSQKLF